MRPTCLIICLVLSLAVVAQPKFIVTVTDEANNPVVTGLFLNVADTGITVAIDNSPVFIPVANIHKLQVEKNNHQKEFVKLGATTAAGFANRIIDQKEDGTQSGENKKILVESLQLIAEKLLASNKIISSVQVLGSAEILREKLTLLQQFSFEQEINETQSSAGTSTDNTVFSANTKPSIAVQVKKGNALSKGQTKVKPSAPITKAHANKKM